MRTGAISNEHNAFQTGTRLQRPRKAKQSAEQATVKADRERIESVRERGVDMGGI